MAGTTPTLTIGDAGAEDTKIVFDGNAVDFVVGLDDSADEFRIGVGSALGSTRVMEIDSDGATVFQKSVTFAGSVPTVTVGDGGAEDALIIFDGNAQNFHIGLDDSGDLLTIGLGNTLGTTAGFTMDENTNVVFPDNSVTIVASGNGDNLTLISTDADANAGPNLRLYRNSANPADSDTFGQIDFEGRNDNSQDFVATQIAVKCGDVSDGTEDAEIQFDVMTDGTLREYMRMASGSNPAVIINQDSRDINFQVLSDGQANMFLVDGGGNHVLVDHTGSGVSQVINGETATLQVRGNTFGSSSISISNHQAANSEPSLLFYKSRNTTPGSFTSIANNDSVGHIWFAADDGTDGASGVARIVVAIDGAPGANDTPGRMQFYTTNDGANSPTEKMRIHSTGDISIARTTMFSTYKFTMEHEGLPGISLHNSAGNNTAIGFYNGTDGNAIAGYISVAASGTQTVAYNTSSDYRLKENVNYTWDATTRLKQLKPARFNWIADDNNTVVDGFLAHEVSDAVPEAINGTKDATETKEKVVVSASGSVIAEGIDEADWTAGKVADKDGNTQYPTDSTWEASKVVPVYQAIDQSKLVPLLVKTIQELEARITTLEG